MSNGRMREVEHLIEKFLGSTDTSDPKVRKKLKILEGATDLFIQHGYRKTSVDDIAQRAAVAKGTVYLYFQNKAEILMAAIAMEEKQHLKRLEPIFEGSLPPKERLQKWLSTALMLGTEMPLTARILSGDHEIMAALEDLPPDVRAQSDDMTLGFARELLDEAAAPHSMDKQALDERAAVVAGLMYFAGMLMNQNVRSGLSLPRYAEVMAELVVHGVAPPPVKAESNGTAKKGTKRKG